MVAVFIDKILRFQILAVFFIDLDLGRVFFDHVFKTHRAFIGKSGLCKGKRDASASVVKVELSAEEQFKFLEVFLDRPMRQSIGKSGHIPRMRESVTDEKILVFFHFLPFGEVVGIPTSGQGLAYLLCDVKKIRLPRQTGGIAAPLEMRATLRSIVNDMLRLVLNVARIVVNPRQGNILAP